MQFIEPHFSKEISNFAHLVGSQSQRLTLEGVHDLRVSTRRLRSHLRLIQQSSAHHVLANVEATLKILGRALGERRQWDVSLQEAPRFHLKEKDLHKKQLKAGRDLRAILRSENVQALPTQLREFERTLRKSRIEIHGEVLEQMRSELKSWLKQKKFSAKKLHKLRIEAKKIRYAFECMDLPVQELKELQDHLGKSHDLTVLSEYFHKPKDVHKADRKERKKAKRHIRPALRSSLDVLKGLR